MSDHPVIHEATLRTWRDVVDAVDYLGGQGWVFRGQLSADWTLQTSLERETNARATLEKDALRQFMRSAPRLLPGHLVPADTDAVAWLGLIQHYGGPTRLLDVTHSPYAALFFAFEAPGEHDRALWAIQSVWCLAECARAMHEGEGITFDEAWGRLSRAQAQLVFSLIYGPQPLFKSFKPFSGVFPVEPWKPEWRQSAQQALFLCAANVELGFMENLAAHSFTDDQVLRKFVLPHALRQEAIEQLAMMNVTAATLFPDLGGLARSLRTLNVRRIRNAEAPAPWDHARKSTEQNARSNEAKVEQSYDEC